MDLSQFYDKIGLDGAARALAERTERGNEALFQPPYLDALFSGTRREEGLRQLKALLGEDEDGIKTFVYMSRCALRTYENYRAKGVPEDVFWATMGFLSRFMASDAARFHKIVFRWGWWFPRQLAMEEFRIGALEYEMAGDALHIHIPADADLSPASVQRSLDEARAFFAAFYPAYKDAPGRCESWMLSPALEELLPPTSNVLAFGRRFRLLGREQDSPAFLEWIYPDPSLPTEQLPEDTSLRRAVKRYLLDGGKVGWASGELR